jgi:hypothetical protein
MDWNVDPSQFSDEFELTPIQKAMKTVVETAETVVAEMKENLNLGETHQMTNRLEYLMNTLSKLSILTKVEDDPSYTDEDIDALLEEIEVHGKELDFNSLFSFDEDGEEKRGIDILDYLKEDKSNDGDFDF